MKPSEVMFDKTISNRDKFGVYLKCRRNELSMTLKDFAKELNLSMAYVSDMENGNRYAPLKYLNTIIDVLHIEKEEINYFYDLAGCTHSNWVDINEYLATVPNARKAIRLARDNNISEQEFVSLVNHLDKESQGELER